MFLFVFIFIFVLLIFILLFLSYEGHKIIKDITMVETNYTDYSLVLKYKSMDKEYTQIALYGKSVMPYITSAVFDSLMKNSH